MIEGIKHIIFDLGGVLLNIDYAKTEHAFHQLGIKNFNAIYTQLNQSHLFDQFEIGAISSDEFIAQLKGQCRDGVTNEDIISAWNAMLLDFPLRRLQILQQLRIHFDLVLLSNTNSIHEQAFHQIIKRTHNVMLPTFFDRVYLSHRVGLRKPDVAIFQQVLDECGFQPAATLFIDDSPQHIEGAKKLGIQTIHLTKGMTIEQDIFKPKS